MKCGLPQTKHDPDADQGLFTAEHSSMSAYEMDKDGSCMTNSFGGIMTHSLKYKNYKSKIERT